MDPQVVIAFVFGIAFVVTLLVLAVKFPNPTPFQYTVFRIVLALAAAGVAAMIPGIIKVEMSAGEKFAVGAGGALAVFVIVFFKNPAGLIRHPGPTLSTPPQVTLAELRNAWVEVNELNANELIGPDVSKAATAMTFTAMAWNHGQMDKDVIYETCYRNMEHLFTTLESCETIVPGYNHPGRQKKCKDFITEEIRRCYNEMKAYKKEN
jgi:hypothetical protein